MLDIEDFFHVQDINNFWIAYSGGLDSSVLLHLIATYQCRDVACNVSSPPIDKKTNFFVVHINHGLSPNAQQWEQDCKAICEQYQLPYQSYKVDAKPESGQSPEAAARNARYSLFKTLLQKNDCLVTAHHQQDQIETLFLQLFRGAGIKGLAAMPKIKKFGKGYLLRPLLNQSRQTLLHYAEAHQLKWIDDESNFDTNFDRNYIRHELLPVITNRWPGAFTTLPRVTALCAEANELMDEVAENDYQDIGHPTSPTLNIPKLLQLSSARQNNLLRYWILQLNFSLPTRIKLAEICKNILNARNDANPLVHWKGVEIRRYRDELYAGQPLADHDPTLIISWNDPTQALVLPNELGQLELMSSYQSTLSPKGQVTIRFRQGGEKILLSNRQGHHNLKKLFQEWGVPPWLRDRIPLLYVDEKLTAVGQFAENNVLKWTRNRGGI